MRERWKPRPDGRRKTSGTQDAETDRRGVVGARVAAACRPTRTFCPGAREAAHSVPVHVTVVPLSVQDIPHAFVTAVVPGASNDTDHAFTAAPAVRESSAT